MLGGVRFLALGLAAGLLAGCQTDGLVAPEANSTAAKPRVIDTAKTAARTTSKKDVSKTAAATKAAAPEQGDGEPATTGSIPGGEAKRAERSVLASLEPPARATATPSEGIPAKSLFGNWTLGEADGSGKCRFILGGVLVGSAYSARGEADCPAALTTVHTWEIQGDELILRNPSRAVIGRLQPTGPFRFDGQAGGAAVYLIR